MIVLRNIILAICALLLCVSLLLWWRSHWTADGIYWASRAKSFLLISTDGRLALAVSTPPEGGALVPPQVRSMVRGEPSARWEAARWNHDLGYKSKSWAGFEFTAQINPTAVLVAPNTQNQGLRRLSEARLYYQANPTSLVAAPYWFMALMMSIPLALFVRSYRQTVGHLRAGRCAGCGYDLRATPDRCPECGAVPSAFQKFPVTLPDVKPRIDG